MFKKFLLISLYNAPLILLFFKYMLNQDFRLVEYDSEPDYIMNGLQIIDLGVPVSSHHPGTITYYLMSFFIKIFSLFNLSLSQTIIFIRSSLISLWLGLLFIINHKNMVKAYFYGFIVFIIPGLQIFLGTITSEILLFSISIFLSQIFKKHNFSMISTGLLIAIGISVKLSFLLVIPILFFNLVNKISVLDLIKLIISFCLSIMIIEFPVFPEFILLLSKFALRFIKFVNVILQLNSDYLSLFFISIIILIIGFYLVRYKNVIFEFVYLKSELITKAYILFLLVPSIFISLNDWTEIRHIVVLIPFAIESFFTKKFYQEKHIIISINILSIFVLAFLPIKNIDYNTKTSFDSFVELNKEKTIITIMNGIFYSEYVFKEWAQYRYGNSYDLWNIHWIDSNNLQLLNTRNLDCKYYNPYVSYSFLENWLSPRRKNNYKQYYPKCIDNQINDIVEGQSILVTFNTEIFSIPYSNENNNKIEILKTYMYNQGYEMHIKDIYNDFTIWGLKK